MYISQLPYAHCCHDNHEIKGDLFSFEYFQLLIIPNTQMRIFKFKTPADMSLTIIRNKLWDKVRRGVLWVIYSYFWNFTYTVVSVFAWYVDHLLGNKSVDSVYFIS